MAAARADTIFAQSTPVGRSGVAVVRLSGPDVQLVVSTLCGNVPEPRHATLTDINGFDGRKIDTGLVLYFPGPASFTGEDCAEFQVHGSLAGLDGLMTALSQFESCRHAEAGEFTMRAMAEGKLDLAQVEGLSDLLEAETAQQHQQSLNQFDGVLSKAVLAWRKDLLRAVALIEATVDFVDEDVPVDVWPEVRALVVRIRERLQSAVDGYRAAEIVRTGFQVALVGPPNAGKSTLLNALAGREIALVSEHAGTTRDVIEARLNLDGLLVVFSDLAGIRKTENPIEKMGIRRAIERASEADLRVFLSDDGEWFGDLEIGQDDLFVSGKADLGGAGQGLSVSGETGIGLDELLSRIKEVAATRTQSAGLIVRLRHQEALNKGLASIKRAEDVLALNLPSEETLAADLRQSILALESVVGHIGVEDVLGEIFSSFCIGK